MPESSPSEVTVARTATGFLVRVVGRGTMRESRGVEQLAACELLGEENVLGIDLTDCDYLDSTFLGSLVQMHKRAARGDLAGFYVVATPEDVTSLLAPLQLDRLLNVREESDEVTGEFHEIPPISIDAQDMGRHALECHRLLAEMESPQQAAFEAVVEQLSRELG